MKSAELMKTFPPAVQAMLAARIILDNRRMPPPTPPDVDGRVELLATKAIAWWKAQWIRHTRDFPDLEITEEEYAREAIARLFQDPEWGPLLRSMCRKPSARKACDHKGAGWLNTKRS